MKRTTQILVALMGMLLISFAVPLAAQAEQCSADGKVCLVTDTSQSLVSPVTLQFKVTPEANYFEVNPSLRDQHLVGQDANGMNIWTVSMNPGAQEGPNVLTAHASGPGLTASSTFEFTVPVLAAAANNNITIRRTKKRVTAIYEYDGRSTLKATVQLFLNSFDSEDAILLDPKVTRETGVGHQVLTVSLSRKLINKKCRTHGHCSILAEGRSESGEYPVDQGTYERKTLTTPRLRHKRHRTH